jgi:hypothetical protein
MKNDFKVGAAAFFQISRKSAVLSILLPFSYDQKINFEKLMLGKLAYPCFVFNKIIFMVCQENYNSK